MGWEGKILEGTGIFWGHAVPEKQGSEGERDDRKKDIDQLCWWQY